ncbi:hypothetical protein EYC80_004074 [Monilinia laxa]|uniref:Uncharacterized protein n=1 Tax=Monilinia laxa TaxID=61186 RepID=A0A5N6KLL6_MONLA|nr:hypothetical protein EYC80_004074 [Monilinia laxa]
MPSPSQDMNTEAAECPMNAIETKINPQSSNAFPRFLLVRSFATRSASLEKDNIYGVYTINLKEERN